MLQFRYFKKFHLKGSSALEFALVLPAFMLLICGLVDLARYYFMEQSVSHTLRAAARYAVTGQLASNSSYNAALNSSFPYQGRRQSILAAARSNNPGSLSIDPTNASGAVTDHNFVISSSTNGNGPWTVDNGGVGGQYIRLTLTNNFNFATPFLNFFATNLYGQTFLIGGNLILKTENFSTNDIPSTNAKGASTNYWN